MDTATDATTCLGGVPWEEYFGHSLDLAPSLLNIYDACLEFCDDGALNNSELINSDKRHIGHIIKEGRIDVNDDHKHEAAVDSSARNYVTSHSTESHMDAPVTSPESSMDATCAPEGVTFEENDDMGKEKPSAPLEQEQAKPPLYGVLTNGKKRPLSVSSTSSSTSSTSSLPRHQRKRIAADVVMETDDDDVAIATTCAGPSFIRTSELRIEDGVADTSMEHEQPVDEHMTVAKADKDAIDGEMTYIQRVVREILDTERCYVKDLDDIIQGYRNFLSSSNLPIGLEEQSALFGNIDSIFTFNSTLLKSLERNGDDVVHVMRCFVEAQEGFEVYTHYCTSYPKSVEVLSGLMRNETYSVALRKQQMELGHSLPLGSYLLKPVQRVLKYRLLLQNLLSHLSKTDAAHTCATRALTSMSTVSAHINEMKRRHEHALRAQEVQAQLTDWSGPDLSTLGNLVLECSNLMLVESIPKEPLCFHVIPFDNPRLQYTVQARTLEQKRQWCCELKRLILESYSAKIPAKARELVMTLGESKDEADLDTSRKPHSHNAPEYLERRRGRRRSTPLADFSLLRNRRKGARTTKEEAASPKTSPAFRRRKSTGVSTCRSPERQQLLDEVDSSLDQSDDVHSPVMRSSPLRNASFKMATTLQRLNSDEIDRVAIETNNPCSKTDLTSADVDRRLDKAASSSSHSSATSRTPPKNDIRIQKHRDITPLDDGYVTVVYTDNGFRLEDNEVPAVSSTGQNRQQLVDWKRSYGDYVQLGPDVESSVDDVELRSPIRAASFLRARSLDTDHADICEDVCADEDEAESSQKGLDLIPVAKCNFATTDKDETLLPSKNVENSTMFDHHKLDLCRLSDLNEHLLRLDLQPICRHKARRWLSQSVLATIAFDTSGSTPEQVVHRKTLSLSSLLTRKLQNSGEKMQPFLLDSTDSKHSPRLTSLTLVESSVEQPTEESVIEEVRVNDEASCATDDKKVKQKAVATDVFSSATLTGNDLLGNDLSTDIWQSRSYVTQKAPVVEQKQQPPPTLSSGRHYNERVIRRLRHVVRTLKWRLTGRSTNRISNSCDVTSRSQSLSTIDQVDIIKQTASRLNPAATRTTDTGRSSAVVVNALTAGYCPTEPRHFSQGEKNFSNNAQCDQFHRVSPADSQPQGGAIKRHLAGLIKHGATSSTALGARLATVRPLVLGSYTLQRRRSQRPPEAPGGSGAKVDANPRGSSGSTPDSGVGDDLAAVSTDKTLPDSHDDLGDSNQVTWSCNEEESWYEQRLAEDLEVHLAEHRDSAVYSDGASNDDEGKGDVAAPCDEHATAVQETVRQIERRLVPKPSPQFKPKRMEKPSHGIRELLRSFSQEAKDDVPQEALRSARQRELEECATLTRIRQNAEVANAELGDANMELSEKEIYVAEGWVKRFVLRLELD